jgi:type VI secretion system protein ImpF
MYKKNPKERLPQSLLERLLVFKRPELEAKTPEELLILSVEQDLQNLLNTRKICPELPNDLKELETSLVNYGIPDLTTINIYSETEKQNFCTAVQIAIEYYEPRLKYIKVELVEIEKQIELIFKIRISATLLIDPEPIPVSFDSALLADTRLFDVKGQALAHS